MPIDPSLLATWDSFLSPLSLSLKEPYMGVLNRAMVVMVFVLVMIIAAVDLHVCDGAVYKVGDSTGWTTIGNFNYKKWAATKTFNVGDIIYFEYNAQFHNVMQVTHPEYKACNASTPIVTHSTGNDSITIKTRGHHYFLCGIPGHCQSGQKVDINVPRISASTSMAPTPSALPSSPDSNHSAKVPGPSPSSAVSMLCSLNTILILWAILVGLGLTISA